jgi:hypothetical protein
MPDFTLNTQEFSSAMLSTQGTTIRQRYFHVGGGGCITNNGFDLMIEFIGPLYNW